MLVKTLSAVTAAYIFVNFWLSLAFQNTYMSMLFGANAIAGSIKLILFGVLIYMILARKFKFKLYSQLFGLMGCLLVAVGAVGIVSVDFEYLTYPYLMSMDFVTMTEIGLLMCLASLTYGYHSAKVALRWPAIISWQSAQLNLLRSRQILSNLFVIDSGAKRSTSEFQHRSQPVS